MRSFLRNLIRATVASLLLAAALAMPAGAQVEEPIRRWPGTPIEIGELGGFTANEDVSIYLNDTDEVWAVVEADGDGTVDTDEILIPWTATIGEGVLYFYDVEEDEVVHSFDVSIIGAMVQPASVVAGGEIGVAFAGLTPEATFSVDITNDDDTVVLIAEVDADENGTILETEVEVPADTTPGSYTLRLLDDDEDEVYSLDLTVTAIPYTGSIALDPVEVRAGGEVTITVADATPEAELTVDLFAAYDDDPIIDGDDEVQITLADDEETDEDGAAEISVTIPEDIEFSDDDQFRMFQILVTDTEADVTMAANLKVTNPLAALTLDWVNAAVGTNVKFPFTADYGDDLTLVLFRATNIDDSGVTLGAEVLFEKIDWDDVELLGSGSPDEGDEVDAIATVEIPATATATKHVLAVVDGDLTRNDRDDAVEGYIADGEHSDQVVAVKGVAVNKASGKFEPGGTITISGLVATPDADVEVVLFSNPVLLAETTADEDGNVDPITFTLPDDVFGEHHIVVFDWAVYTPGDAPFDANNPLSDTTPGVLFLQAVDLGDAPESTAADESEAVPAAEGGILPRTGAGVGLVVLAMLLVGLGIVNWAATHGTNRATE